MNRNLAVAIATLIALAMTPLGSGAAPKSATPKTGAICSPQGKVQIVGSKKFTCLKSGKKLVWSKPNTVRKPTPAPTPAPTILAQPTLDSLDSRAVYEFSRASITETIAKNGANTLSFNYLVGPNVALQTVDSVKVDMKRATDLWGPVFSPADRFTVIWYVKQDLEWAANAYRSESGNPLEWSNINESCTTYFCGNATATRGRNGTYVFEQGMTLDRNGWNRATAGHEFTHLAQNKIAGPNMYKMPLWLVEGSAQFYGEATGYHPDDQSKFMRRGMHGQFAKDAASAVSAKFSTNSLREVLGLGKQENTVALMKSVEFEGRDYPRTALAYLVGSYASEVLVSVYGHEKFVDLYRSFENSSDWEANFQKVYGVSVVNFYEKLTPYFAQMKDEL